MSYEFGDPRMAKMEEKEKKYLIKKFRPSDPACYKIVAHCSLEC